MMELTLTRLNGTQLLPWIDDLGRLRMQVFRDYPYLYEGDLAYERKYLQTYAKSAESLVTLVHQGSHLVGATTAILATHEEPAFQKPLIDAGLNPNEVCYFGESLLIAQFRGRGVGKVFMQDRIKFAEGLPQVKWASFCAVQRSDHHHLRPKDYRPLDEFWRSVGFSPLAGVTTQYSWRDIEQLQPTDKLMQYWIRPIRI